MRVDLFCLRVARSEHSFSHSDAQVIGNENLIHAENSYILTCCATCKFLAFTAGVADNY